jgi:hypothetical protein
VGSFLSLFLLFYSLSFLRKGGGEKERREGGREKRRGETLKYLRKGVGDRDAGVGVEGASKGGRTGHSPHITCGKREGGTSE